MQLEEAGFKIVESTRNACSGRHEIGCRDEFQEWGFPCGGGKRPHKGSCHNFLFARNGRLHRNNP